VECISLKSVKVSALIVPLGVIAKLGRPSLFLVPLDTFAQLQLPCHTNSPVHSALLAMRHLLRIFPIVNLARGVGIVTRFLLWTRSACVIQAITVVKGL
jgi:hypothetical protein